MPTVTVLNRGRGGKRGRRSRDYDELDLFENPLPEMPLGLEPYVGFSGAELGGGTAAGFFGLGMIDPLSSFLIDSASGNTLVGTFGGFGVTMGTAYAIQHYAGKDEFYQQMVYGARVAAWTSLAVRLIMHAAGGLKGKSVEAVVLGQTPRDVINMIKEGRLADALRIPFMRGTGVSGIGDVFSESLTRLRRKLPFGKRPDLQLGDESEALGARRPDLTIGRGMRKVDLM